MKSPRIRKFTRSFSTIVLLIPIATGFNTIEQPHKKEDRKYSSHYEYQLDRCLSEQQQVIQTPPLFPGGDQALIQFLDKNIKGMTKGNKKENESTITIIFRICITEDGKATYPEVLRIRPSQSNRFNSKIEKEIFKAVMKMPVWEPGRINGDEIEMYYNIPVRISA